MEAYPESNQRHLFAESGLYYTEGMFGMRPAVSTVLIAHPFTRNVESNGPV